MKKKRILALMLVLIMSILSACGTKKTTDVKKEATTSNTGMGRYVEESVELPEMSWPSPLFEMQDVTLEVLDQDSFRLISSDASHNTWTEKQIPALEQTGTISYAPTVAISPTGDLVMQYLPEEEQAEENNYEYNPKYQYIKSDGTVIPLELSFKNGSFLTELSFTQDNRVIGYDYMGKIYEIKPETNEQIELFSTEDPSINSFSITKHYIITMAGNILYIFDLAKNQLIDVSSTLTQFIKEQNINPMNGSSGKKITSFMREKKIIPYLF